MNHAPELVSRRRVLVVSWWLPSPPPASGGPSRTYHIVRQLATHHHVRLLAYASGPQDDAQVAALAGLGVGVRLVPPPPSLTSSKRLVQLRSLLSTRSYDAGRLRSAAMQQAIDAECSAARPDVILVELSQMAHFKAPAGLRLVVDEQNIEYELHRRLVTVEPGIIRKAFNLLEAAKIRREEPRIWRNAHTCLLTSEREAAIVRRLAPSTRTLVVPNGVDTTYFQPAAPAEHDPQAIVFTGRMSYRPNTDAALFFVREVLPSIRRVRPATTLYLVGQDPPNEVRQLAGPGVVVTGEVDDIRPYLAQAAVVIAPLRAGSGTRIKILEALAMARPVVATPLAAEGLELVSGHHLLLAQGATDFALAVVRLLDDPQLGERLGRKGRALIESVYAWEAAVKPLETILASVGARASAA